MASCHCYCDEGDKCDTLLATLIRLWLHCFHVTSKLLLWRFLCNFMICQFHSSFSTSSSFLCISSSLFFNPCLEFFFDLRGNVFCLILVTFNGEYAVFLILMRVIFIIVMQDLLENGFL